MVVRGKQNGENFLHVLFAPPYVHKTTLKAETAETALWEIEPVISFFLSFSFPMKDALLLLLVWENIACWRCTFALRRLI